MADNMGNGPLRDYFLMAQEDYVAWKAMSSDKVRLEAIETMTAHWCHGKDYNKETEAGKWISALVSKQAQYEREARKRGEI